ncbi:MAG: glycoside hydrolase family 18 [Bacteroidales bacterium]|nr:glycoside hydrolase family 18 [Bacteroidales bacterium]
MKNIIKPIFGLLVFGSICLVSCTDMESIDINEKNAADRNSQAYAKYVSNLVDYKASDHQVVYGFFDNSNKEPFSSGQHITSVPDSIDVIVMTTPALEQFELDDIAAVREMGTKVFFYVSYDDIESEYNDLELEGTSFANYLQTALDGILTSATGEYDGIVAGMSGSDPIFLSGDDYTAYQSAQNVFLNAISLWLSKYGSKEVALYGLPQNLIDRSILSSCSNIILNSSRVASEAELDLLVAKASVDNVPTDRFMMGVSTVSLSSLDSDTGYWDGDRALARVAYWATVEEAGYTKTGIAIIDVQNDYFDTNGVGTYVRQAIEILNPSPAK